MCIFYENYDVIIYIIVYLSQEFVAKQVLTYSGYNTIFVY